MTTARRRSATVALGVTALLAAGLTGCSSDSGSAGDGEVYAEDTDYQAVCVDEATQERIDDDHCDDGGPRYHGSGLAAWYFLSRGAGYPRVGRKVTGGTFTNPSSAYTVRRGGTAAGAGTAGAATRGGTVTGGGTDGDTVSRGGFGGSSRSSGS
jgi:hypothetical protein